MHSSVLLDEDARVVRPAILWNDVRTTVQCRFITHRVGKAGLRRLVGNPALEGFTAPKLLWVREHEPRLFGKTRRVLLPKDYVRFLMTGELATEPSDAAGTLLFDVKRGRWSEEMITGLRLDPAMLPPVFGSSEITGTLTEAAADALGLERGTPVVGGGADNAAASVGSGVVSPGSLQTSIGTIGRGGGAHRPAARRYGHEDPFLQPRRGWHVVPDGRNAVGRGGAGVVQTDAGRAGWLFTRVR